MDGHRFDVLAFVPSGFGSPAQALADDRGLPPPRARPAPQLVTEDDRRDDDDDDDDADAWLGGPPSKKSAPRVPSSPTKAPPPGEAGFEDRLDNFLAKLSGRVAALSTEMHARLPPQRRLPARRDALLRTLGSRKLREALDRQRSSPFVKLTPTQMFDALADFRTPGQPLLHDRDVRRLWDRCEEGDPEAFLKLFRDHEAAGEAGVSVLRKTPGSKKSSWATTQGAGPNLPRGEPFKRRDPNDARSRVKPRPK